jgi:hypothetical protein
LEVPILGKFKSSRGKNKHLTAQKSNYNTVWFNFQTYIYICIYMTKTDFTFLNKWFSSISSWISHVAHMFCNTNKMIITNGNINDLLLFDVVFMNYWNKNVFFCRKRWSIIANTNLNYRHYYFFSQSGLWSITPLSTIFQQ